MFQVLGLLIEILNYFSAIMSSKRKMTEEEDEHSKDNFWKKLTRYKPAKRKQKFKIHYIEFLTAANRDRRKKTSATLELNEDTSEEEIRNSLISELSQLKDQKWVSIGSNRLSSPALRSPELINHSQPQLTWNCRKHLQCHYHFIAIDFLFCLHKKHL